MRSRKRKLFFIIPAAIVGITLFMGIGGWLVMSLWNWLLPALFGWRMITFWRALGMLVLCRILFGGFGHHGIGRSRRDWGGRWGNMSDEERAKFREAMRAKWGFGPPTPGTPTA